jgi:CRISPR system Cascade subunit CasB
MSQPQTEDYINLFNDYKELSNGEKASIRREVSPEDLQTNPVFYRLIAATSFADHIAQATRLVYLMPFIHHQTNGKTLGALLKERNISERRLFLVIRSEYPQDLIHLRRLCQQFKEEKIDGVKLGKSLFYWDWGRDKNSIERSKRELMQNFYLSVKENAEATNADY